MKKRIVIGLVTFLLIFFVGGIYFVVTIEKLTSNIHTLIKLHQVEIMRQQLLLDAKRVQTDLAFMHTRYAQDLDLMIENAIDMSKDAKECSNCHHSPDTEARIEDLKKRVVSYRIALSRVLTISAGPDRQEVEADRVFYVGQELINRLDGIIALTSAKLTQRTRMSIQQMHDMKVLFFLLIALGPCLAVTLAAIFIRGLTGPVRLLLHATRKLKGGDLSFRIEGLKDEFKEVADSFNEMASSLKDQMEKMQRAEQMTVVGAMAASLVHEIKNPLAGIKASMQVLLEEDEIPERDRLILSKVLDEVKRVESLMKSLLSFARPPKPQFVTVQVNEVLESSLGLSLPYSAQTSKKGMIVEVLKELDPDLPPINADPMQLQQVFLNIVMNAFDAMPDGGRLTVRTRRDLSGQGVRIEVADTGKGIDEQAKANLFRPFFTTKHKGTGLGLATTKQFVEMHGGTITVKDNPEGGTIFDIVLPYGVPQN